MSDGKLYTAANSKNDTAEAIEIGTCALCDVENVLLMESHSIPKFVYKWIKDTARTSYLRSNDDVNVRHQDGPKEYLLCGICEGNLALIEKDLAENLFKKVANYRKQERVIVIAEAMRTAVLSIFWRALLTTKHRNNNWTVEDCQRINSLLSSMKADIRVGSCTTRICLAPFYGDPPYYNFPKAMTYFLERSTGGQDVRFFDGPHRFFTVFRLPFMYFYFFSNGWSPDEIERTTELAVGDLDLTKITTIPVMLEDYIEHEYRQYLDSLTQMDEKNRERIREDSSKKTCLTGSDKSSIRSGA
jgi:hypothetical protein